MGDITHASRLALVACAVVGLAGGCHKKEIGVSGEGIVPSDPQVAGNLANLSQELRHAMPRTHLSGSFEEFVSVCHLEVPPPPPGEKYAISKKWKVILVDAK